MTTSVPGTVTEGVCLSVSVEERYLLGLPAVSAWPKVTSCSLPPLIPVSFQLPDDGQQYLQKRDSHGPRLCLLKKPHPSKVLLWQIDVNAEDMCLLTSAFGSRQPRGSEAQSQVNESHFLHLTFSSWTAAFRSKAHK